MQKVLLPKSTCKFSDCVLLGAAGSRSEIEQMVENVNSLRKLAKLGECEKQVQPNSPVTPLP